MSQFVQTARSIVANLLAFAGLALFALSVGHVIRTGELPAISLAEGAEIEAQQGTQAGSEDRQMVILDPGHGGLDGGTVAGGSLEKALNLDTARRVAARLEAAGLKVIYTREDDSYLKLNERSAFANKRPAALFVSIHHNASTSAQPGGVETYFTNPKPASVQRAQRRLLDVRADEGFVDRRGEELATRIQRAICAATSADDRGVKNRPLAMTRWVSAPAVLIECGFLSNPAERAKLAREDYREEISAGIAEGILAFLGERERDPLYGVHLPDRDTLSELADIQPEN